MHSLCDVRDLDNIRSSCVTTTIPRSALVFRVVATRPDMSIVITTLNEQHPREGNRNRGVGVDQQQAKDVPTWTSHSIWLISPKTID